MNRCLRDQTLLLLHDGEATGKQRDHLTECERCAARYRDLEYDLAAINQVLRDEPPPQAVGHRFLPRAFRWTPAALAVGLALVLMWQGMRMWNSFVRPYNRIDNREVWSLLDDFPTNLFSLNEAVAVELWSELVTLTGLLPLWRQTGLVNGTTYWRPVK